MDINHPIANERRINTPSPARRSMLLSAIPTMLAGFSHSSPGPMFMGSGRHMHTKHWKGKRHKSLKSRGNKRKAARRK